MGMLDNLKAKAGLLKGKAGDLAQQHGDKIERGLDKAAKTVDGKTKGKYSGKIETGTSKAKDALDRLSQQNQPNKQNQPNQRQDDRQHPPRAGARAAAPPDLPSRRANGRGASALRGRFVRADRSGP
ncbi:antitoxin [Streptomyces sp. M19]